MAYGNEAASGAAEMPHSEQPQPATEVQHQRANAEPVSAEPELLPAAVDSGRPHRRLEAHNSRRNMKQCERPLSARRNRKTTARRIACRRVCLAS